MPKVITNNDFKLRVREAHGNDITILGEYKNRRTKILVKHKCGYTWEANPEPLTKGHGCPCCSSNLKKTSEMFEKEVFLKVGKEYSVIGEYINNNTPILLKHNTCGNEFFMSPKAFLQQGQRCPNERYLKSAKANTMDFEEIKNKINTIGNGDYKIISEYQRASKKVTFLHEKCGKTFEMSPSRFITQGIRCCHCYRSKGEEVIRDYLTLNAIDFKEQYKIQDCRNIRPLPFDFVIFKDNKIHCLIEYDGSQHFSKKFNRSTKAFEQIKHNDEIKNKYCLEHNIILIRIKYVRSENPNIFKNKVIEKLKKEFAKINMIIPSEAS